MTGQSTKNSQSQQPEQTNQQQQAVVQSACVQTPYTAVQQKLEKRNQTPLSFFL
jgi:hypothetical protein